MQVFVEQVLWTYSQTTNFSDNRGYMCKNPWFYFLYFVVVKWKWSCSVVSDSLLPHGLEPARLLHPCNFPGKNTGVGCHFLLQFCSKQPTMYWLKCILQPFLRVRNNFCYGIFPYFMTLIKLLISVPNTAI